MWLETSNELDASARARVFARNRRQRERSTGWREREWAKERVKRRILYSMCTRHTIRSTGARVLTRIRPRTLAPYDALTHSVVKAGSPSGQTHPAGNYYDKLRARQRHDSFPAKFHGKRRSSNCFTLLDLRMLCWFWLPCLLCVRFTLG